MQGRLENVQIEDVLRQAEGVQGLRTLDPSVDDGFQKPIDASNDLHPHLPSAVTVLESDWQCRVASVSLGRVTFQLTVV